MHNLFRWTVVVLALLLISTGDLTAYAAGAPSSSSSTWAYLLGIGVLGATLATGSLTLADWAKRLDPDGKTATIVELLQQRNELLDDMV